MKKKIDHSQKKILAEYLLAMADDEMVLGQRDSEWCGHAPILEEDIAFANIALDEIGHASAWYGLLAELIGEDPDSYPDRLVFFRPAEDYRNLQMVELPKGDWAFSVLRQYLFDAWEQFHLEALSASQYGPMAEVASKIIKEELYHIRHTRTWVRRLGLGTEESRRRMQQALEQLWPLTRQFFLPINDSEALLAEGYLPRPESLKPAWEESVRGHLRESGLENPAGESIVLGLNIYTNSGSPDSSAEEVLGREQHSRHLALLLAELQSVARLEPEAEW